jgi:VIT1/CCC1 family predicted Fe2+/Mn2+ transporter
MTGEAAGGSFLSRLKESIHDSAGDIIFGMSDGVVSIFGLVLGVAAGAQSGNVVFLAGATGAIAASVSMMAGLYLDLESESDEARVEAERREAEIRSDPTGAVDKLIGVLQGAGLSTKSLNAIRDDMQADPVAIRRIETAISCEEELPARKIPPIVHASWMGITNFVAGITPVIPFAFLPFAEARVVCIAGTATLLLLLGIGRARIGNRPVVRTVFETIAIATAAAIAGVLFGWLIS